MGAKGKYNEETVNLICETLKEHCIDKIAYERAGIHADTYYEWLRKYPIFSDRVRKAKAEFRSNVPDDWVIRAKEAFREYLFGEHVELWEHEETIDKGDGKVEVKRGVRRVKRGTPIPIILRILGEVRVVELMKELLASGVATNEQAEIVAEGVAKIEADLRRIRNISPKSTVNVSDKELDGEFE